MTRAAIMAQILHEVTGNPREKMVDLINAVRQILGVAGIGFDKELSPEEAAGLLVRLRAEKAGILAWLVEGSAEAHSFIESMREGESNHVRTG